MQQDDWLFTPRGEKRGYIEPHGLEELWFHSGTACNLACPFCLEGSKPGDRRLDRLTWADARPFLEEARELGVAQLSFTGGEPFVDRDFVRILEGALDVAPCLVLTNGTDPLLRRLASLEPLRAKPHPLSLRVSLDYPDAARHDAGRGAGAFAKSLETLRRLHALGLGVSVARQAEKGEEREAIEAAYRRLFEASGLPTELRLVAFPEFGPPGSRRDVPEITESCMTTSHTERSRREFMCAFSKMVVKLAGRTRVYACTLVDDDPAYDQGGSLREARGRRVMLRHHRCYSCFALGASCSEARGH